MNFELPEELRELQRAVREFAEKEIRPYGKEYDEKGEYPMEMFRKAAKMRYIGVGVPEEYGGAGMKPAILSPDGRKHRVCGGR